MDFDKIKKDDTVLIKAVVASKTEDFIYVNFLGRRNERVLEYFHRTCVEHLECEPTPKHAPCRKFRKGDKVRVVAYKGRTPKNSPTNEGCVLKEENDSNTVIVNFGEYGRWQINVAYLELNTPVEEFEPYSVKLRQELTADDTYPYCAVVDNDGNEAARFYCELYEAGKARAAAEAECARMNAEYRKEVGK